jgi:probable rRNA maturation factor
VNEAQLVAAAPCGTDDADDPGSARPADSESAGESDQPPPPETSIDVLDQTGRVDDDLCAWLTTHLRAAIDHAGATVESLVVTVVGDDAMTSLHVEHCGIAGSTDVLTFDHGGTGAAIDADIAICLDEAARRASEHGHAFERELLLYAVHGVLHCLGHDDHEQSDYDAMHAREDAILTAIGIGPTFTPTGTDDGGAAWSG